MGESESFEKIEQDRERGKAPALPGNPRARLLAGLPVSERRLRLNGIETGVLEGGEGTPVVLLHGPGEYGAKWFRVIPDLAATHRVIVPDLPGHGDSAPVDAPFGVPHVLGWLDDLIECTCPTAPVLVGQVLGGALAARFACGHGERLRGLVLVDSLGLTAFRPAPAFGRALTEFIAGPSGETHDRLWQQCAFDLRALRDGLGERWQWIEAYNLDRAGERKLGPTQQALMEQFGIPPIPPDDLARIRVPTALIWGRHDLATPLSVAEAAAAAYGWPLHVIEDAADDPPLERPEAFLNALRATLGD